MPRGRKRKITEFVPPPWIQYSSSEEEYVDHVAVVDDHDGDAHAGNYF